MRNSDPQGTHGPRQPLAVPRGSGMRTKSVAGRTEKEIARPNVSGGRKKGKQLGALVIGLHASASHVSEGGEKQRRSGRLFAAAGKPLSPAPPRGEGRAHDAITRELMTAFAFLLPAEHETRHRMAARLIRLPKVGRKRGVEGAGLLLSSAARAALRPNRVHPRRRLRRAPDQDFDLKRVKEAQERWGLCSSKRKTCLSVFLSAKEEGGVCIPLWHRCVRF
ncbi:hypothetical protein HPB48_002614 [Haemaphysalis longicornis]|uniref:Uncharacterized protein n=1 Tax=Haemaphysalis longicornis TaxID=44386 RepID=A0A9J6G3C5_HAELO|nr:hypothetical protein HPB48_002614 [Haemaphysalis longicornis]